MKNKEEIKTALYNLQPVTTYELKYLIANTKIDHSWEIEVLLKQNRRRLLHIFIETLDDVIYARSKQIGNALYYLTEDAVYNLKNDCSLEGFTLYASRQRYGYYKTKRKYDTRQFI